MQLSDLQVERLTAKTVSGDIDFDGSLARGGRYEFNAHSGDVRLVLANVTGFELDASTFSGSIRSDFPVTLRSTARRRPARPPRHEQPRDSRHLRRRQRDPRHPQLLRDRRHHEEVERVSSSVSSQFKAASSREVAGPLN